jgi:hypothetical protein
VQRQEVLCSPPAWAASAVSHWSEVVCSQRWIFNSKDRSGLSAQARVKQGNLLCRPRNAGGSTPSPDPVWIFLVFLPDAHMGDPDLVNCCTRHSPGSTLGRAPMALQPLDQCTDYCVLRGQQFGPRLPGLRWRYVPIRHHDDRVREALPPAGARMSQRGGYGPQAVFRVVDGFIPLLLSPLGLPCAFTPLRVFASPFSPSRWRFFFSSLFLLGGSLPRCFVLRPGLCVLL